MMLKLIKNYLKDRTQKVLVNGKLSSPLKVKSGVPQGSILGPLLFILFINDMQTKISEHTQIALYADDTIIWCRIKSPADHLIFQSDINALCEWARINKMKFHPEKCKILSVNNFHKNSLQELPFYYFPYELDNVILDYTDEEKDLGILTTTKFNFKAHQTFILNKAVTQFNILRRTCHFVNNSKKRRTLYLTLVRSLFNHCSEIWCPSGQAVVPFENFQKRCIKWILKETYMPYSESEYYEKLKYLEILPMDYFFLKHDIHLFYKVIHEVIPIKLPEEIVKSRLCTRSSHNDNLMFNLHESIRNIKRTLSNSYFIRSISNWNRLPKVIRESDSFNGFKSELDKYFWSHITSVHIRIPESDREPD